MAKSKRDPKYKMGECGACGETKNMHIDDYQCVQCRGNQDPVQERLHAAEDVCWTLLMMMALGGLEIEQEWKDYLFGPYDKWTKLAVDTGVMETGEEDAAHDPKEEEDQEAEPDAAAGDQRSGSVGVPS
jgi:hypothetical protein